MARGINKVIIVGNLGQDPEVRYMPTGGAVANISVATSESWTDKQTNEKKEHTEWHRCVAYQRLAEIIGEYCRKGSKVYLEGKLKTRKWTDQQGVERYTTEIIIDELQMLDGAQAGQQQQNNQPQGQQQNQRPVGQQQQPQGQQRQQQQYAGPTYNPQQQQQQQRPQGQQNQQRPYNQPQGGYNANGSAAPNMHGVNQTQGFNQNQPPIDFDDDIPF